MQAPYRTAKSSRSGSSTAFDSLTSHSADSIPVLSGQSQKVAPAAQANPVPPAAMPDPPKRFQFIDNSSIASNSTTSTQVRRHVMQEFMRQKRWQAKKRLESIPKGKPDPNVRRPVQKIRSQRRVSTDQPSSAAPTTPVRASISRHVQHTQPENDQAFISRSSTVGDDEVEDVRRAGYDPLGLVKDSEFYFIGPATFARLAEWTSDDSAYSNSSIGSCDSWSSISSPPWQQNLEGASPEPQTFLSAARTDPFDCLPMRLNHQDQELFDFYANVMPACSYGFERRSPNAHNWYLSVFIPEAMKGAVCFQNTILVHAANTQAWVKRLDETPLSIEHRARASKMLLDHFQQSPMDHSDASISATLSAAALEDFDPRIERREYAWTHFRAAVQKIRDRGGPSALVHHNRLQMLINWSDYIFSGYHSKGATFYFDHESSPVASDPYEEQKIAMREVAEQCEEFIKFLRCSEHLALVQANVQTNAYSMQRQPMRYSAFLPGQPLREILASPPGRRYTDTGQLKQILSRLASLLTINTAVWEYRHSTGLSEAFLRELDQNLEINELDKNLSAEALIQILLSGSSNPQLLDTERSFFVGRMLKVAKRLKRSSFEKVNDILLKFLTLGPNLQPVMLEWENELRMEILQAPLASYVLPIMQGEDD